MFLFCRKWNQEWHKEAEPFIETVEKTQGREVDCTIVDYGLLNTSQIKNELRFIYSRPRLNVSLTRAKKKCVVIVSDILLSAAIEHIFDSKETERGFTHFQVRTFFECFVDLIRELTAFFVRI